MLLLISACQTYVPEARLVELHIVTGLDRGYTMLNTKPCQVVLGQNHVERLILHELRHCDEGQYHAN